MTSSEIPPWLKRAFATPNALYRNGLGGLLGHRFVQITHVGRRSGRIFTTVLEVVHYDHATGETFVVSGFGWRADWLRNIQAGGGVSVSFGRAPRGASYRLVSSDEAAQVYAGYERRNWFMMPMARPMLAKLAGFDYRGTDEDRRRVFEILPMVAFSPA